MYSISKDLLVKESLHALVYLNPSPVLPGHCIALPRRQVAQLEDLSIEESADFWKTIQETSRVLKNTYSAPAFTIELKTKVANSLYANIIPRQSGDLEQNDMIYPMLEAMVVQQENISLVKCANRLRNEIVI